MAASLAWQGLVCVGQHWEEAQADSNSMVWWLHSLQHTAAASLLWQWVAWCRTILAPVVQILTLTYQLDNFVVWWRPGVHFGFFLVLTSRGMLLLLSIVGRRLVAAVIVLPNIGLTLFLICNPEWITIAGPLFRCWTSAMTYKLTFWTIGHIDNGRRVPWKCWAHNLIKFNHCLPQIQIFMKIYFKFSWSIKYHPILFIQVLVFLKSWE